jgi:TDG/mug DNA glycosylase family protein
MTKRECAEGAGRRVPDLIADDLRLLLVGINPSTCSGAAGLHFASPGNRLWPTLFEAGFTDRQLLPDERDELLARGIGISNLVNRATVQANEVDLRELRVGAQRIRELIASIKPRVVAVLGIGEYRTAFEEPSAQIGRQPKDLSGVPLWVLPNPSGRAARYTVPRLAPLYREVLVHLDAMASH